MYIDLYIYGYTYIYRHGGAHADRIRLSGRLAGEPIYKIIH